MPVSSLDPAVALIVIDLQEALRSASFVPNSLTDTVARARALAEAFAERDLPVILVRVAGGSPGRKERSSGNRRREAGWTNLLPELGHRPWDHIIEKQSWGAFTATGLDTWLRNRGVTQVIIVGCATSIGVESTARQAHELGYNVAIAIDAVSDGNADAHWNSVNVIFPRLGETGSTQDCLDMLSAR